MGCLQWNVSPVQVDGSEVPTPTIIGLQRVKFGIYWDNGK